MLIALTGTPGTGKTYASNVLQENGFEVGDLNKIAVDNNFLIGTDEKRKSRIIDIDRLNEYVKENYKKRICLLLFIMQNNIDYSISSNKQ